MLASLWHLHRRIAPSSQSNDGESSYKHFLSTRRPLKEIDSTECSAWIQTGLALTPFAGCVIQHTCDWTIAWSLIGEWTSQEIFLSPAGEWPRNGHSRMLLEEFDCRRPCLLTPSTKQRNKRHRQPCPATLVLSQIFRTTTA